MTIHLSCGHVAEDGCLGVHVEFQDETCVAGEGFVPCTVNAVYCHKCAMDLAAAEERAKIVAWLRETQEAFQKLMDLRKYPLVSKHHMEHCKHSADAIEAKEHLK